MARDQFRHRYGDGHPRIALCYRSIGHLYFEEKNFELAISSYQNALKIDEKCLPLCHPALALTHNSLAMAPYENGQRDLAFEHGEKALATDLKKFSADNVDLLTIYVEISQFQQKMGNVEKSIEYLREAAVVQKRVSLKSPRRFHDRINYVCRRCRQVVWAYAGFDRIKETCPVCFIFHSKLSFWLHGRCQ